MVTLTTTSTVAGLGAGRQWGRGRWRGGQTVIQAYRTRAGGPGILQFISSPLISQFCCAVTWVRAGPATGAAQSLSSTSRAQTGEWASWAGGWSAARPRPSPGGDRCTNLTYPVNTRQHTTIYCTRLYRAPLDRPVSRGGVWRWPRPPPRPATAAPTQAAATARPACSGPDLLTPRPAPGTFTRRSQQGAGEANCELCRQYSASLSRCFGSLSSKCKGW